MIAYGWVATWSKNCFNFCIVFSVEFACYAATEPSTVIIIGSMPLHNTKRYPWIPVQILYPIYWGVETRLPLLHTDLSCHRLIYCAGMVDLAACLGGFAWILWPLFLHTPEYKGALCGCRNTNQDPFPDTVCPSNHGRFCSAPWGLTLGDPHVFCRNILLQKHQRIARSLSGAICASKIPG